MRQRKQKETIGESICAAVLGHLVGISTDSAMKLYVRGRVSPEWEELGEALLAAAAECVCVPRSSPPTAPQIVRPEPGDEIGLFDAADLLEMPQESLCRLAEEGKLRSRRSGDELYFLREEIQALHRKQVEEVRAQEAS